MQQDLTGVAKAAAVTGLIGATTTALAVALRGERESGSAIAPINATSHVAWGDAAAHEERADVAHTVLGAAIHTGAGVFWASVYEKLFGERAERGDVAAAFAGGAVVAGLAYLTDYHIVPKRLTPGWEHRVSGRSLALTYAVLALSFPLRGLVVGERRRSLRLAADRERRVPRTLVY